MKIVIGSDKAGYSMRQHLIGFLTKGGHTVKDMGTSEEAGISHPIIARNATREFLQGSYDFGVLICGSGTGISIAANKVKGIRCALLNNIFSARIGKEFNKANFIAFGGATTHPEDAQAMLAAFMTCAYKGTELDWVAAWDKEISDIEAEN
jgi:ribose 5-phosphate isomerase B